MNGEGGERIGLLGGAFNPVHIGHLLVAQEALEQFELDRVLLIPSAVPPHKPVGQPVEARHRSAMLEHALQDDDRMETCLLEIERGGVSYTLDTLLRLRASYPGASFFFLIGSDLVSGLREWKAIEQLGRLCRFVVCPRPGHPLEARPADDWGLPPEIAGHLMTHRLRGRQVDVSSSEIRRRVAEGLRIRYLVPAAVEMYIAEHGLYLH